MQNLQIIPSNHLYPALILSRPKITKHAKGGVLKLVYVARPEPRLFIYLCHQTQSGMALKKLPVGLQDFRKIIEYDFKYIDKTRCIYQICQSPGAYFLSRPRRFSKSITIATMQELYLRSRELFKGLWIEDKWNWGLKCQALNTLWRTTALRFSLKDANLVKDAAVASFQCFNFSTFASCEICKLFEVITSIPALIPSTISISRPLSSPVVT